MKKFSILVLFVFFTSFSFSAPVIKAVTNGYWNNTATWDLNRLPQVGDTIEIPAGGIVTVTNNQNLDGFVYIKIYGRLTFQGNSSVLNLGSASTVYVFSGGQIIGGGNASQKIKINGLTIFQGNDAPINGPQVAYALTTGFQPAMEGTLPVTFIGFSLTRSNTDILVQWSTSQEINAAHYELERSQDGRNWNRIATIQAAGNSQNVNNYAYTDRSLSTATVYYRIRQVDQDGRSAYTPVKSIRSDVKAPSVNIAAAAGKVVLQFAAAAKGNMTIRFVNMSGQVVDQQLIANAAGLVVLPSKVNGNYIISVSNGQDMNVTAKVIL